MTLLTLAAIGIVFLTAVMLFVEGIQNMRKAARDLKRFEREMERERGAR